MKDFTSEFAIGDHVLLAPPAAQVVGVSFRSGPTGTIDPYYILLVRGQLVENIPAHDILGIDPDGGDTFGTSVDKLAAAGQDTVPAVVTED
ncbi:MAG: hypothetical protein RJA98_689 [Pseudomonadota bacterium]